MDFLGKKLRNLKEEQKIKKNNFYADNSLDLSVDEYSSSDTETDSESSDNETDNNVNMQVPDRQS